MSVRIDHRQVVCILDCVLQRMQSLHGSKAEKVLVYTEPKHGAGDRIQRNEAAVLDEYGLLSDPKSKELKNGQNVYWHELNLAKLEEVVIRLKKEQTAKV